MVYHIKEEDRRNMFEKRQLRRIFGPKRYEVTGGGENFIVMSFIIFILLEWSNQEG
jgi:hypothetical protein